MHENFVFCVEFHAFIMIKYTDQQTLRSRIFTTPFDNELSPTNRWVQLEKIVPWDRMSKIFFARLDRFQGRGSIDLRIVMGAMFIQHSLNLTDRATIELIQENIYMQYFVGLPSFQIKPVFDHSLLSVFRKRLGKKGSKEMLDIFIDYALEKQMIKHRKSRKVEEKKDETDDGTHSENSAGSTQDEDTVGRQGSNTADCANAENRGTVKIDATVIPENITYPTDTKLLNKARELSEQIIDELYEHQPPLWKYKPRTYRREARKKWLSFSKSRKPGKKKIRGQKKADLAYLRRNLKHIDEMMAMLVKHGVQVVLKESLRKKLYVISEVYRQQNIMYKDNRKKISDRIVSISQPWIRPMVRGKAGSAVEFGAKINISVTEKMVIVDQSSFDAFNESTYLIEQLERYKAQFGYYPEYALVDKIYLTRANRKYMQEHGIKHTGSPLGRPPKQKKTVTAKMKKKNNERNHVEGKIGQAKLKYGLNKLRTKLKSTSYCAINLIALAMNMLTLQKRVFCFRFNSWTATITDYIHFYISTLINSSSYTSKILHF